MVKATYMYTTGLDSNWYTVNISDLTADLLSYFEQRAARDPRYTKITDTAVQWSTQFESATEIVLIGVSTTDKGPWLETAAVLSAEERRDLAVKVREQRKTVTASKDATKNVNVDNVTF